jgi:hypothetical protein
VSSTYSVLCLSHNPSITAAYDCGSPERAAQAIAEGIDGHEHCDLLIGRYSYPLVEAGCPDSREQPAKLRCVHGGIQWVRAEWLRLLDAAYRSPDEAVKDAAKVFESRCWSPERLSRLREELGIEAREPTAAAQGDPPVVCWHTEAGTPCDWDVCKQPERLAAGDRGTDPKEQY